MTTTSTFTGLDPEGRSSSRILRPPGGGSSFSFGVGDQPAQPARRHKMASNIFGVPDYNSMSAPCVPDTGAASTTTHGDSEDSAGQRTTPAEEPGSADYLVEPNVAETDAEPGESTTSVAPAEPAAAPTRRNPPGGKSSLVLG